MTKITRFTKKPASIIFSLLITLTYTPVYSSDVSCLAPPGIEQISSYPAQLRGFNEINLAEEIHESELDPYISDILKYSKGTMTVYDFLLKTPLPNGGYSLGLTASEGRVYQVISGVLGLTRWKVAYNELFQNEDLQDVYKFMEFITETDDPIVIFVPRNLFSYKNPDPDAQTHALRVEVQWLLDHPERMKNVYFVFGAYNAIDFISIQFLLVDTGKVESLSEWTRIITEKFNSIRRLGNFKESGRAKARNAQIIRHREYRNNKVRKLLDLMKTAASESLEIVPKNDGPLLLCRRGSNQIPLFQIKIKNDGLCFALFGDADTIDDQNIVIISQDINYELHKQFDILLSEILKEKLQITHDGKMKGKNNSIISKSESAAVENRLSLLGSLTNFIKLKFKRLLPSSL